MTLLSVAYIGGDRGCGRLHAYMHARVITVCGSCSRCRGHDHRPSRFSLGTITGLRMTEAFICDAVIRTPIGRYGGALSSVRTDDLAAIPIKALMARNPSVDPGCG